MNHVDFSRVYQMILLLDVCLCVFLKCFEKGELSGGPREYTIIIHPITDPWDWYIYLYMNS